MKHLFPNLTKIDEIFSQLARTRTHSQWAEKKTLDHILESSRLVGFGEEIDIIVVKIRTLSKAQDNSAAFFLLILSPPIMTKCHMQTAWIQTRRKINQHLIRPKLFDTQATSSLTLINIEAL